MLNDLTPTPKITAPKDWQPAVTYEDGMGEATTQGYTPDEQPDFQRFLQEAGFDPNKYQIIGEPRTSRWQVARPFPLEPQWLTAYRFRFTTKTTQEIDLPLTWANAKQNKKTTTPTTKPNNALVIALADLQLGKTDHRGGTPETLQRIFNTYNHIIADIKKHKYEQVILADVGDIVEGFNNKADQNQLATNDLSLMAQIDTAIALIWELITQTAKHCPNITYATIASNHCQNRINKQQVGKPGEDDWGIMIAKQIHRLAKATKTPVTVAIPEPHDESLAIDVFGDGYHILGIWHGHQARTPDQVPAWWQKQAFGHQPLTAATIGLTGHFHHLQVRELGESSNGSSRYWIQASTMDAGSNWFKLQSGTEATTGITTFTLNKQQPFNGSVRKL